MMLTGLYSALASLVVAAAGFFTHLNNRVTIIETKSDLFEQWLSRVEAKLDRAIEHE